MTNEELYYLPASELLKHIQAEKEHLIKEKIIKKSKPLPPITEDEKPYELPKEWEWVRLGEVITILSGVSYKKNQILNSEDGTRIIRGGNIQDNEVVLKGDDIYVPDELVSKEKYIQKGDTVIVSSTGSLTAIGRPGIVSQYYQNVAIGAFLRIIRPNKNINAQFISYILFSDMYRMHIRNIVKGTSINNIKNEYIEEFLIPLPPLYIQDKIVQNLEELSEIKDSLLSHAEAQLNDAKKMREALLQEAIRGELVPQDENDEPASVLLEKIKAEKERLIKQKMIKKPKTLSPITEEEKPYELPTGWKWVRLGEYIKDISGGSTPSKQNDLFWNGSIPWASVKDLKDYKYLENTIDRITEHALENTNIKLIPENQLIVCTRVGLGKVLINKIKTTINQDLKSISLINNCSIEYLYYAIKTLSIEGTGTTVKGITQEELLNKIIPIPPRAEQERIVEKLDELMINCDQLEAKAEEMKKYTTNLFEASLKEAFMPE